MLMVLLIIRDVIDVIDCIQKKYVVERPCLVVLPVSVEEI